MYIYILYIYIHVWIVSNNYMYVAVSDGNKQQIQ